MSEETLELKSVETQLSEFLEAGIADERVLAVLFPEGRELSYESDLWDYKTGFAKPAAQNSFGEHELCSILKDIAAFHNAFGGYLLFLLPEKDKAPKEMMLLTNAEVLSEKMRSYSGKRVRLRLHGALHTLGNRDLQICLMLIPKRPIAEPPLSFRKDSAKSAKGTSAFSTGDIFARDHYQCVAVGNSVELMRFLIGSRNYLGDRSPLDGLGISDHNLPPEDPNLIRFIGRNEYLIGLWSWLRDMRNPVRVITGMGGFGKTAVAYEFCKQVVRSERDQFEKVIWLTGKSKTFSPILGKMVSTTRTDFSGVDTFLNALLDQLATTDDEIDGAIDRDERMDLARGGLTELSILLVVDDVDTLDPPDQQELFAITNSLFNQAAGSGGRSRALLTSRLELAAGPTQTIRLKGFSDSEAERYVDSLLGHLEVDEAIINQVQRNRARIIDASKGSPIFIASILRLAQHGVKLPDAINKWKDSAGEDVRRFAFSKEISELDYQSCRVLYVMQTLARSSVEEIAEIIGSGTNTVLDALAKLRQYHLYSSAADPITGAVIEAPQPVRLTVDITKKRIQDDDLRKIDRACARMAGKTDRERNPIALAFSSIVRLWRKGEFGTAVLVAEKAVRDHPKVGELSCVLGRCYLKVTPPRIDLADNAFKEASLKNCTREELLLNWVQAKAALKDWRGLDEVTQERRSEVEGLVARWRLSALVEIGRILVARSDLRQGIEQFKKVMSEARAIIDDARGGDVLAEIRALYSSAAREFFEISTRSFGRIYDEHVTVYDAMLFCVHHELAPLDVISEGVQKLRSWWQAVERRKHKDFGAMQMLERRLVTLAEVRVFASAKGERGRALAKTISAADEQLRAQMTKYKNS